MDLTTQPAAGSRGEVVGSDSQVVTTVLDSSPVRLCERCWRPLSTGTVFRVFRHAVLGAPDVDVERLSFRHLDDDPACTGAQLTGSDTERVA